MLGWLVGGALAAIGSTLGALAGGAALTPPASARRDDWIDAGPADAIPGGRPAEVALRLEREDGYRVTVDRRVIYLVRDGHRVRALSAVCTHLGCRVAWHEPERQFRCPCHGGQFDGAGTVVGGPPPRPLDELAVRLEHGRVLVRV